MSFEVFTVVQRRIPALLRCDATLLGQWIRFGRTYCISFHVSKGPRRMLQAIYSFKTSKLLPQWHSITFTIKFCHLILTGRVTTTSEKFCWLPTNELVQPNRCNVILKLDSAFNNQATIFHLLLHDFHKGNAVQTAIQIAKPFLTYM